MSGLDSALARIGAIERMVSGPRVQAAPPDVRGATRGATSFADALDQATLLDAATSPAPIAAAVTIIPGGAAPATLRTARGALSPAILTASRTGPARIAPHAVRTPGAASASYRPAHVTETDERVWNDCTWAAASMWIDKLTGGAVKVDREKLRAASGDLAGGSSLGDVVKGARKLLGLDLRGEHDERLTVNALLDRLASGGGAIVQGSYASLPKSLTRHDPGFAAKGVAASGHAVYVGPLDRATGKVWWDDPLAPAGGSGQWISVKDLKKFMWTDAHGRVSAMATPAGAGAWTAASAGTTARAGDASTSGDASAISAAARSAGVDPQLLSAYLDVTGTTADAGEIAAGAHRLAAAMTLYGRADTALESIGAARAGATRLAEGAVFAGDVLTRWAELLGRRTAG